MRPNWSGFMQSVCHGRHAGVSSVDMLSIVDLNPSDGPQEPFLANTANKKAFIDVLMLYLHENGIAAHQAPGDADGMIVSVALHCARQARVPVVVFAEDTDIFALLLYHRNPDMVDMYFVSESKKCKGGNMVGGKCISISSVQSGFIPAISLHDFAEGDVVSYRGM